jgi:hypothetical protein
MVQLSYIFFAATVLSVANARAMPYETKFVRRVPYGTEFVRRVPHEFELVRRTGTVAGCGSRGGLLPNYCTAAGDGTHHGYCGTGRIYGVKSVHGGEADADKAKTCREKGCGCE